MIYKEIFKMELGYGMSMVFMLFYTFSSKQDKLRELVNENSFNFYFQNDFNNFL
jgi:hypothetical protein